MNFYRFFVFSLLTFFHPFFVTFFISFFVWPFIFLITSFFKHNFPFLCITKLFNLSLFECVRYLCMSFCSWILFICCLFFSLRFFSFLTHVFPFSLCLLCPQPLWKTSWRNCCKSEKTCLSIYLFVGHFSYLFVFAIFVFSNFFVLFSCVFEHFSFWVLVLECFFLCRSLFLCISFSEDPVWFDHPFSFLFFLSFYILSLLTRMLNGYFRSDSIACVVDTSHSARQADMDDMVMKRSAANKRDKTSKQNKDEFTFLFIFFLFSPFSFLSFLHSFFLFGISCFLIFFFSIAVFVYLLFVVPHCSSLSFVLDLFCILLYTFFLSSPYLLFWTEKNQKILWSIF